MTLAGCQDIGEPFEQRAVALGLSKRKTLRAAAPIESFELVGHLGQTLWNRRCAQHWQQAAPVREWLRCSSKHGPSTSLLKLVLPITLYLKNKNLSRPFLEAPIIRRHGKTEDQEGHPP